jgi:hypothetical protein
MYVQYRQGLAQHIRVKVIVTLRLAVYRKSVRFGAKHLETHDQGFFLATEPLLSQFLCNIISNERMGLSVVNRLHLWHR